MLDLDLETLLYFAYNNESLYKHYTIPKKTGGHRDIYAPDKALKTICKKLNYYLGSVYEEFLPKSAHGFVNGRGIVTNAQNHLQRNYVLNIDLNDFFGVVNSGRVMGLFKRYPFRFGNKLSSVLTGITTRDNCLPQGSPTSPVIANMVCLRLDKDLIRLAHKNGWRYSRYADDITFSANSLDNKLASNVGGAVTVGRAIVNTIESNGFTINQKKTRLAVPNQSKWVTGIKVNKKCNLSRKYIRDVRSMLNAWEVYGEEGAEKKFNDSYNSGLKKSFRQVLRGRIDHIGNVRDKTDLLYRKLFNRLCDLEGKFGERLPESKKEEYLNKVLIIKSTQGIGSGFFISKNTIVTCAHVVGEDGSVEFTTRDKRLPVEFRGASVLCRDVVKDFAVLYTASDNSDLIFKSNTKKTHHSYSQTEDYVSLGYGGFRSNGNFWSEPAAVDQNIVQKEVTGGIHAYLVNNPMWSGMSGGPVISEQTDAVDGYIVQGSATLAGSTDIKSFKFYPISNIPSEYFQGLDTVVQEVAF